MAGDPSRDLDDLEHRVSFAGPEVGQDLLGARLEASESAEMSVREIGHVDVVTDAGAVGCVVVVTMNRDRCPLAQRHLERDGDQMGLGVVILAQVPIRVGAAGVEVPKRGEAQPVRVGEVTQNMLDV